MRSLHHCSPTQPQCAIRRSRWHYRRHRPHIDAQTLSSPQCPLLCPAGVVALPRMTTAAATNLATADREHDSPPPPLAGSLFPRSVRFALPEELSRRLTQELLGRCAESREELRIRRRGGARRQRDGHAPAPPAMRGARPNGE